MRKVFFSFHHKGDIGRIGQVRNAWLTKGDDAGYVDDVEWESIKRNSEDVIKRWIDSQLNGTSVTIVLIGEDTYTRPWVKYEIVESHKKRNGIIGIYIHNLMDFRTKLYGKKGKNPFGEIKIKDSSKTLADFYPVYDWVNDNGYCNINKWIEEATKKVNR